MVHLSGSSCSDLTNVIQVPILSNSERKKFPPVMQPSQSFEKIQPAITCLKLTIETLEHDVKFVQICSDFVQ